MAKTERNKALSLAANSGRTKHFYAKKQGNTMRKIFTLITTLLLATSAMADDALTNNILFDGSSLPTARIPAIVKTNDGMLVGFSDRRKDNSGDIGSSNIDVVYRTSNDNGATWSTEQVAIKGGDKGASPKSAYGDAAVVCDRETGKLLIMCASGNIGYSSSNASCTRSGEAGSYTYSVTGAISVARTYGTVSDGTITWDTPTDVTNDIYGLYYDENTSKTLVSRAFFGSGRICQSSKVKVGEYYRLYAALTTNRGSLVVYSDDFGGTWNCLGGYTAQPATSGDEAKVEELPNGNVLLNCRTTSGRIFNIYTYSDTENYSAGSWGTAGTLGVAAANCNGEILLVPNGDSYVALLSVAASSSREKVGIYYKTISSETDYDEVSDFTTADDWTLFPISTTSSCYSTMVQDANNNIAFVYEEASSTYSSTYYYDIIFKSFTLSDIIGTDNTTTKEDYFQGFVGKIITLKVTGTDKSGTKHSYFLGSTYQDEKFALKMIDNANVTSFSDYQYYWVVNQDPDSVNCYISAYRGDGYMGNDSTYDYSTKKWSKDGVGGTDDYTKEFYFTGFVKQGKAPDATTPGDSLDGYALRFWMPGKGIRFVAVKCADGSLNFYNHTTKGDTTALAGGSWTTDFIITEVTPSTTLGDYGTIDAPKHFGWKVTFVRSDDSYNLRDGEDRNYYATLKLPFAVALPGNVKAYKCTDPKNQRNDIVGLTEIELPTYTPTRTIAEEGGWTRAQISLPTTEQVADTTYRVLPRETAVLLCMQHAEGDEDMTKELYLTPMAAQNILESTGFAGSLGSKVLTGYDPTTNPNYFVLGKKNGRVAFYYKANTKISNNKAYYIYTGSDARQADLSFLFVDETTGISTPNLITPPADNDAIYDLMGRRVQQINQKGIYIKNGRKFLVK